VLEKSEVSEASKLVGREDGLTFKINPQVVRVEDLEFPNCTQPVEIALQAHQAGMRRRLT